MFDRAAIVLAGGLSRRMGAENKLLLPLGGQPLLRHAIAACIAATDAPVTVVTGHEATAIAAALEGLPVHLVHNPDFADGQMTSLATGLRAVPDAAATLIALADQPLLDAASLDWLFTAFAGAGGTKITIPLRGEDRGNPIVVPLHLMPDLQADRRNPGCRKFTRDHPELVHWALTGNPAFFTDVDLPEDLARIRQHFDKLGRRSGKLRSLLHRLNPFLPMTDAQASLLASVKFPCC
ncbi:MAG: nucleotidyltransferase family protein [Pseudotabrizicola sp.]|uniref:nucleotidyltransferase family protein n=1 Tax=Pseudotabrizicola sp. TaxID=2939647 RepID=UPI0027310098|nr:nucleotidyltransferase family protein [Pseudotabrizicola sp.]MDP2079501.1 nucleotidyltransferase family protein [Pseudotabrizicola sp.]MDZ7575781.1 nucleotidyltransferase family protein [Pseudotabrizicola sp.]